VPEVMQRYLECGDLHCGFAWGIQKILRHLNLWDPKIHGPPFSKPDYIPKLVFDGSYLPR
jgi:hypothetical protein